MDNTTATQVPPCQNRDPVKQTKQDAILESQLKEHNECSNPQTVVQVERTPSQDNALAEMIPSPQQNLISVGEKNNHTVRKKH